MAQYSKYEVLKTMESNGMVPLFFHSDINVCKDVLKACYDGGARVLEFTARGDFAHEIFGELVKYAIAELPGMVLGVGSITDAGAASLYMQLGANFVVTPVFREDIAKACNRRKVLWSPGCGSLTEIATAEEYGCDLVKLFPGGIYGAKFVAAVKAPQPWTNIMPTGGVALTEENLSAWFAAKVTCVGMGSQLISKDLLASKDYAALTQKVKDALALIETIRNK